MVPAAAMTVLLLQAFALAALAGQAGAAKTVHVVFSNHLDIGFDNIEPWVGWDNNVLNKYFNTYLPLAVDVSDWMKQVSPHNDSFVYTSHPFVLSLFLDCPPNMGLDCPSEETKDKVLRGITSSAITWQAHPHNAQYEFYDVSLLEFASRLTHDLDARFGLKPKITVTLRDVPGLTRAAIPVLVSQGIKAVSVGVNGGSAPPGVPRFTPFIWRDEASGTQLLAFWRPGGYGGVRGDWDVNLDPPQECIQAPGLDHVLCTSWRNDNAGPPNTVLEPLRIYDLLRKEWGSSASSSSSSSKEDEDVTFKASSIDDFVEAVLEALPHLNLTVVTGEIGDTWVFGVQSDPLKTANFRAVCRARAACIADLTCPSDSPAFYNFSRLLLKVPEHTWGVDIKKTLHDFLNYSNADFHTCLPAQTVSSSKQASSKADTAATSRRLQQHTHDSSLPVRPAPCLNYEYCIHAWDRQAAYIDWALQALPTGHPVAAAFAADLADRQQLAGVTAEQLLAAGATMHGTVAAAGVLGQHEAVAASRKLQGPQQQQQQEQQQEQLQADVPRAASSGHVRQYSCGSWRLELDEDQGGFTSLVKVYGGRPGVDWAGGRSRSTAPKAKPSDSTGTSKHSGFYPGRKDTSKKRQRVQDLTDLTAPISDCSAAASDGVGVLGQLVYNAYCEASYDLVWNYYSWRFPLPWWFPLDFGKVNSSAAWNKEVQAVAQLEQVYESRAAGGQLQQLSLRYSFPQQLVELVGAPPEMWTVISCPAAPAASPSAAGDTLQHGHDDDELQFSVAWKNKTPTRLPEALWLSFRPDPAAVDLSSWRLHKLGSQINPSEVILNGSQSMHAVSEAGVSVDSADGSERLQVRTLDTALVSPGSPTPFPNGVFAPCMADGMHFSLVNNIWGTNYVEWVPYSDADVDLAFRFSIQASQTKQRRVPQAPAGT